MRTMCRLVLGTVLGAALLSVGLTTRVEGQAPSSPIAAAALKPLRERVESGGGDTEQMRRELMVFQRTFPGTLESLEAAKLLRRLPSPLDLLNPQTIPAVDRFDWQPKELVAVLGEHRGRQGGEVRDVAYSRDGRWVASGGHYYGVRIWDPQTMRQKYHLRMGIYVHSVAFDMQNKQLACGGAQGQIRIYDMTADPPKLKRTMDAGSTAILSLDFSPDGKRLVCGCTDTSAQLWELTDPPPKFSTPLEGHLKAVRSVLFAQRGTLVITGSMDGNFRIWDVTGPKVRERSVTETRRPIMSMSLGADGANLATGHADGSFSLWNIIASRPKERGLTKAHKGAINRILFTPSGRSVATAGVDRTIRLWDVTQAAPVERLTMEGHANPVTSLAFSPNGMALASGSEDWTVRMWNMPVTPNGKAVERYPIKGHLSHVYSVDFPLNSQLLASGSYDRTALVWDVNAASPRIRQLIECGMGHVYSVAFALDSKTLATGGESRNGAIWDALSGQKITGLEGTEQGDIRQLQFTPDGSKIVGISHNEAICWDADDGKQHHRFVGHVTRVTGLSVSPDGKRVMTGGGYYKMENRRIVMKDNKPVYEDTTVRLWDLEFGKQLDMNTRAHGMPVSPVRFLPDGRGLSGSEDTGIKLWERPGDTLQQSELWSWSFDRNRVRGLLPSPDGSTILTWVGGSGVIEGYDLNSGAKRFEWKLDEDATAFAFSADSRFLAVGLRTGPVYIIKLGDKD